MNTNHCSIRHKPTKKPALSASLLRFLIGSKAVELAIIEPHSDGASWAIRVKHNNESIGEVLNAQRNGTRKFKSCDTAIMLLRERGFKGPVQIIL